MKTEDITKTIKKDIKELKKTKLKHSFRKYTWKGDKHPYKIDLCFDASSGEAIHFVTCRKIQFKTSVGANKLINMLNKELNAKLKRF